MRGTQTKRFLGKILVGDGCWEWTASTAAGYGVFGRGRRGEGTVVAHRFSYELFVGPIPADRELDHLCRNRRCVRPDHLEPVTRRENILRGLMPQILRDRAAAITHCPRNHPYDEANTYMTPNGTRSCRACKREQARAHYWRKKAAA